MGGPPAIHLLLEMYSGRNIVLYLLRFGTPAPVGGTYSRGRVGYLGSGLSVLITCPLAPAGVGQWLEPRPVLPEGSRVRFPVEGHVPGRQAPSPPLSGRVRGATVDVCLPLPPFYRL